MVRESLNGIWKLHMIGNDSGLLPAEGIEARVPGSVYGALLEKSMAWEYSSEVVVPVLGGVWLEKMDFGKYEEREIHLVYNFAVNGNIVSENTCLFTPPKHYYFQDPNLRCEKKGSSITVYADAYAKNVELTGVDGDLWLSDNFFDMEAGEYTVEIIDGDAEEIACRSVFDIA